MRGVPWRNGVWKHQVVDGPNSGGPISSDNFEPVDWRKEAGHGEIAKLCCRPKVDYHTHIIGERGDQFTVSMRLKVYLPAPEVIARRGATTTTPKPAVYRIGYRDLWDSRWVAQVPAVIHRG